MGNLATVTIAGDTRALFEADESWVTQQVNRRRRDGLPVCVLVQIQTSGIAVTLATPGCTGTGAGGGRAPNSREREVFEMWNSRHLNSADFAPGNVVAFLKQLQRLL
jgi:hypothetical protein